MSKEAMQQALEWIAERPEDRKVSAGKMVAILREALAQPAQQPVAWINEEQTIGPYYGKKRLSFEPYYSNPMHYKQTPLYTAPQPAQQPTEEQEREAFEAWAAPITALAKENGKYVEVMTSLAWEAWKARAAMKEQA